MSRIDFSKLSDWKAFQRLVADVLNAEGIRVIQEPDFDKSGVDILAEETIASHVDVTQRV